MEDEQIARLLEEVKALTAKNLELQKELAASENLREFDANKHRLQFESLRNGLVKKLTNDISLELVTLRDLVEGLDSVNQRRFGRRLDSIELYLREFGG